MPLLSVTIRMIRFFISFAGPKISMVLPYDLDIFWPSIPGTTATSSRIIASGMLNTGAYWWLNLIAMSRVTSRCCFWSRPTGTVVAFTARMSAAISTGYANRPWLGAIPRAVLSL